MNKIQKLPIGISSFSSIRKDNYLYIDKTEYIWNLIIGGKYYFLSRPCRFGKSLLVSTLRSLFEGKRDLFKGLWIYDKWEWDRCYPVLYIDFNAISCEEPVQLKDKLLSRLYDIGTEHGIEIKNNTLSECFEELILKINKKYKQEVVFLIDEYDRPIINHIGLGADRLEIAKANRDILRTFYGVIKSGNVQDVTKFVLLTGVSKFSKVSVFSELNNLTDLTIDTKYGALLGITEQEIDKYLTPYIKRFSEANGISVEKAREKLKGYYNGYRFSKKDIYVYNPYSLLRCLDSQEIENWWFETGTPTFLINLIKEKDYYIPNVENLELLAEDFSVYDIDDLRVEPLLFQTGYITIKGYDEPMYTLGYPNEEVRKSFLRYILREYVEDRSIYFRVLKELKNNNIEGFIEAIKGIFAGIGVPLGSKLNEAQFHTWFYVIVASCGIEAKTEVLNCFGRIDMTVEVKDKVYIMEFKCNQTPERAIEQIKEKRYADMYIGKVKEIYLIGINFSTSTRNIDGYRIERYGR